jgi:hypothetical protein
VQSVAVRGDGASIQTSQWISDGITSTGPLGDLTLSSGNGITNISAPSIFGSISTQGPITGTIQTTGVRTDPITGATSMVPANLGSAYVGSSRSGPAVTSTTINSNGGLPGRIISRGDLVSAIVADGGVTGVIAAQGNLGAYAGTTQVRAGGLLSNGNFSGQLIVFGDEIGDVTLHGGLKAGRVAVKGSVFGNVVIDGGLDSASALVAGGSIGTGAPLVVNGRNAGVIAAKGKINSGGRSPGGAFYDNVGAIAGSPDAAAIDAIFTRQHATVGLDSGAQDLQGLSSVLQDLAAVRVGPNGTLVGPVA